MKKTIIVLLSALIVFALSACQKAAEPSAVPDKEEIVKKATGYFEEMRSGDFETIFNDLPDSVKKQTKSAKTIQNSWNEAAEKAGGLLEGTKPEVSSYQPEHSEQFRVEFVIPCEKADFKVFINFDSNGTLYNYVIWKNN